jgi:hypothetical protein
MGLGRPLCFIDSCPWSSERDHKSAHPSLRPLGSGDPTANAIQLCSWFAAPVNTRAAMAARLPRPRAAAKAATDYLNGTRLIRLTAWNPSGVGFGSAEESKSSWQAPHHSSGSGSGGSDEGRSRQRYFSNVRASLRPNSAKDRLVTPLG